ncbi:MAG: AraC family transcriptional regulator [Alistipes sp.]|nr:AraC family transcriptional regulator [Alistipes sp.]
MDFLYWVVAISAIVIGIFLLSIKYDGHLDEGSYRSIRLLLALGTFLDATICIVSGHCVVLGYDPLVLDQHFVPLIFNVQLSIMAYAMMGLLHLRHINRYTPWVYNISATIATITIFVSYCIWSGGVFKWDVYLDFIANCQFIRWFRVVYIAYLLLALVRTCVNLIRASHRYINIVENYFSEEEVVSGRRLSGSVYLFVIYFVLTALVFLIPNTFVSQIFEFGIAVCLMLFAIMIINLHNTYFNIYPPHNLAEMLQSLEERKNGVVAEEKTQPVVEVKEEPAPNSSRGGIEDIIVAWSKREDKPFVQESLTLLDVAEETKLSPRLLSEFLNKYYKVNFCTWINTLRIEEVKRLLIEQPNLSLADISVMVGFSDPASLSKIFKKISNESPSAYKKRLLA